ncbi:glycoside hydrolase family 3 protein [Halalkalibacter sp. APA_J-10(15)]|uniref:glycoside hydrolase family 3 protein n=1 Tax=Halalkalibacter sp. APA_J-10(15) TaxID=2933805 RepID=UPI001FF1B8F3|nr:glycoside hydrolase family 3 protein [Halalkalibacter sp. APA_J-10(15)]MCK0470627.1 glycoside hydrolase family 3 C-terminal domain-containing protein [Halalkalibacter sp. APA_J-10(15)]
MARQFEYPFQNPELSIEERVHDLVSRFTLDEKIALMHQYQPEVSRLGIKAHKQGTEAAHGIAWLGEATVFPQNIGLSLTWNPQLMKQIGDVIGDEARVFYQKDPDVNGLTLWAPTVDLERDPRWGRTEEAYGEDPTLVGKLATELVKGMQGDHPVYLKSVATLKHFLGNNNELDRGECSASIDPRNMHEYYLKAFEPVFVEGKAKSMMTAYNSINGTPALLHPYVNDLVKEKWNMDGFVVSDAGDVLGIARDHHYYDNHVEGMADTIKSGIDSITDDKEESLEAIRDALKQGLLGEDDLNKALRNAFRVRFWLGEFDPELNPYVNIPESKLLAKEHQELSYKAAKEQVVLLKNEEGTLPLQSSKLNKVAVLGPLCNDVHADWYSGTPSYRVTPLKGIQHKLKGQNICSHEGYKQIKIRSKKTGAYIGIDEKDGNKLISTKQSARAELFQWTDWGWGSQTLKSTSTGKFVTTGDECLTATAEEARGWFVKELYTLHEEEGAVRVTSWDGHPVCVGDDGQLFAATEGQEDKGDFYEIEVVEDGIMEAVKAASEADTAIVFVGNSPFINGKETIDRDDIILPPEQEKLIRSVREVNENTIVVIVSSYPYAVNWADEHIPAILYSSHAGPELGTAMADVLFGDYNPAGRLSMTWYRSTEQLPNIMDYDIIKGKRTYQYFDGDVLYPFGHGLSYTTFTYSDLHLSHKEINRDSTLEVTCLVENTGELDGEEVAQLYVRANQSRITRPIKTLKEFSRIFVKQGEKRTVTFKLPIKELAIWDVVSESYKVESGEYTVMVGSSSALLPLQATVHVQGDVLDNRTCTDRIKAFNYDDYESVYLDEGENREYCVRTNNELGWVSFKNCEWSKPLSKWTVKVHAQSHAELQLRVGRFNGELLATVEVEGNTGWQELRTTMNSDNHLADKEDIYVILKGDVQLSWFQLA